MRLQLCTLSHALHVGVLWVPWHSAYFDSPVACCGCVCAEMNFFDGVEGFGIQELLERVGSGNEGEFMEVCGNVCACYIGHHGRH